MLLYQPERYPVIVGNGTHEGLCTCWTAPDILLKTRPALRERFALIGTLYGREGVSILLRNLLLNPQITRVSVLADNPLSRTVFGEQGWRMLVALWTNGIDEAHTIIGTSSKVHAEIPRDAIERVRRRVVLDVFEVDALASICTTQPLLLQPISNEPESYPEPFRDENAPFPSEHLGWTVRGESVLDAWLHATDRVLRYGSIRDSSASRTRELHVLTWVIERGSTTMHEERDWPVHLRSLVGLEDGAIIQYTQLLRNPAKPTGVAYTYGQRLRDYYGTDQVEFLIEELRRSPSSRRAVASIHYPPEDERHDNPPCLAFIQAVTGGGQLHLLATFRSHDLGKAAIPNAYSLLGLLEHLAAQIGLAVGSLVITSNSAHVYEEEWEELRKLLRCERWSEPLRSFRVENVLDRRGTVHIVVSGGAIRVSLRSLNGDELYAFEDSHARPIILKLAVLELLSEPTHYADIAIELIKAELALHAGIAYTQDKPFALRGISLS